MAQSYLRRVGGRACRNAVRDVTGKTIKDRALRALAALLALLVAWLYVHYFDPTSAALSDAQFALLLTLATGGALFVAWLLVNILFVAPYQLWREERLRAESAEGSIGPVFGARLEEHLSEDRANALRLLGAMASKLTDPPASWQDIKDDVKALHRLMHTIGETAETAHYRVDAAFHYEMLRQAQAVVADSYETDQWKSDEIMFHSTMYRVAASALGKWLRGQPTNFDEYKQKVELGEKIAPKQTSYSLTPVPGPRFGLVREKSIEKPTE